MRALRCLLISLAALAAVSAVAGAIFVYSGVYDVAATEQHSPPVYWLIEAAMRRSVGARSGLEPPVPDISSPAVLKHGLAVYHAQCERCHGGPGVSPEPFALGMMPTPGNLTDTAHRWNTADVYWAVKYGIKMTGMPAWMYRLDEDEMRAVAAFVSAQLRELSPADYQARAKESERTPPTSAGKKFRKATDDEGKRALTQYACATCHLIPGITAATKTVGPPLTGMAGRAFIAGRLVNTRANMIAWLKSPPAIKPGTAMPDLGVTDVDAASIADYLETIR